MKHISLIWEMPWIMRALILVGCFSQIEAVAQPLPGNKPQPNVDVAVYSAIINCQFGETPYEFIPVADLTENLSLFSYNFRYAGQAEFNGRLTKAINKPGWISFLKSVENWTAKPQLIPEQYDTTVPVRVSRSTSSTALNETKLTAWPKRTNARPLRIEEQIIGTLAFSAVYHSLDQTKSVCTTSLNYGGGFSYHVYFLERRNNKWVVVEDWQSSEGSSG
jgi:hypothetical protein